jgi:hypothetical protein
MRAIPRSPSRLDRRSPSRAPAVAATLCLLLLAACQVDSPTAVASTSAGSAVPQFSIVPGAANAAAAATDRIIRKLPTLQAMHASESPVGTSGATTESPYDLTYNGGALVTAATSWNIYVNCPAGPAVCWGTGTMSPASYLNDLNVSSLLEIANQYIGEDVPGHFTVSELQTTATFATGTAQLEDIYDIIYSATLHVNASGYNNIFHVFLPQGQDMCISSADCYSPDNPATWTFCGFHGSVNFSAVEHVLYTVQPYQAVAGCTVPAQTRVIDATASTLTHEFFETITDPDVASWYNWLTGDEVADLCIGLRVNDHIGHNNYVVQEIYSNAIHMCTNELYPQ